MSKSGVFAHFGSKQELQLATIAVAAQRFYGEVVAPALVEEEGRARLTAYCQRYLDYLERKIFTGGCFWAAAASEFDDRPGCPSATASAPASQLGCASSSAKRPSPGSRVPPTSPSRSIRSVSAQTRARGCWPTSAPSLGRERRSSASCPSPRRLASLLATQQVARKEGQLICNERLVHGAVVDVEVIHARVGS